MKNPTNDVELPDSEHAPVRWVGDALTGRLELLDQTLLPGEVKWIAPADTEALWEAIRALRVRGAPAIGIAAAFGAVLGARAGGTAGVEGVLRARDAAIERLRTSRPTAVNLFWALDRMGRVRPGPGASAAEFLGELLAEARAIAVEDARMCRVIGAHGAALLAPGSGVLTHCNAGGLATADYGTALGVIFTAFARGLVDRVYADETRPLLQGARLTAWELRRRGIPVTLLCDSMAAQVLNEGRVHAVIVGADRIAANGDTANKIGTYGLAVLAHAHGVPFYVAAPSSTFDFSLPDGRGIPIEQRDPREVTHGFGRATAPEGVDVYNPAFDVTPARLITALITEKGVVRPVTAENVRRVLSGEG